MLIHSLKGRLQPGRQCLNPSKMSRMGESASYKTHSGMSGSSTPRPINVTELSRQGLARFSTVNSSKSMVAERPLYAAQAESDNEKMKIVLPVGKSRAWRLLTTRRGNLLMVCGQLQREDKSRRTIRA